MSEMCKMTLTVELFEKATDPYPDARLTVDVYAPTAEQLAGKLEDLGRLIQPPNKIAKKKVAKKKTVSKRTSKKDPFD